MQQLSTYPPSPANVPPDVTLPSASFRRQVTRVVIAILAFVLVYLLLIGLAAMLVLYCFKIGILTMVGIGLSSLFILVGLGIILTGLMVLFFLIKFIIAKAEDKAERGIQIFEKDEPQLFQFIHEVATEVGAPLPKKVFLTPEVNASVFYNSSFWSLILPAPKNLNIGLGLVNSLNMSELKAVLAHEFGHFSQDSMRLGSYVYYVNKVIHDMLYRNTGWSGALQTIADIHYILYLFANISVKIVQAIQWILQKMYGFINVQYLKLSREMEFHADTIAASVSGSNNAKQALLQVAVADHIFNTTLNECNRLLNAGKMPENFYSGQTAAAAHFGKANELPVNWGRVGVSTHFLNNQHYNRLIVNNQWESHPSLKDREKNIDQLGLSAPVVDESAWTVFADPKRWQLQLTRYLYQSVDQQTEFIPDNTFIADIENHLWKETMPVYYRGYFDQYFIFDEKLTDRAQHLKPTPADLKAARALFNENFSRKIAGINQDLELLENIRLGQINVRTFDFEGNKYPVAEAENLIAKMKTEKTRIEHQLAENEHVIFDTFYSHALAKGTADELLHAWNMTIRWQQWIKSYEVPMNEVMTVIYQLDANNFVCSNELVQPFTQLVTKHLPEIGTMIGNMPETIAFESPLSEKIKTHFQSEVVAYGLNSLQPRAEKLVDLFHTLSGIRVKTGRVHFDWLRTALEIQIRP